MKKILFSISFFAAAALFAQEITLDKYIPAIIEAKAFPVFLH